MFFKKALVFCLGALILIGASSGCRSSKSAPATYKGRQIIIGQGGGFTNIKQLYYVLDNGKVFKEVNAPPEKSMAELPEVSRKNRKYLFNMLKKLKIKQTSFFHPGNIYYYVELKDKDGSHRITWGDHNTPAPAGYEDYFKSAQYILDAKSVQ